MNRTLKLVLPLVFLASPVSAQNPTEDAAPEKSGPVTRQTANRESALLDFEYSWPQAIALETKLVAQLNDDLSKSYDEALKNAREYKTLMEQNNGPFHQNYFTRVWTLEGQTSRLTSLVSNTDTFTGGAHPNHNSSALLWDRTTQQQAELAQLFASPDGLKGATRAQFCKLLDAERAKRRQGEMIEGEFSQCPPFSELTIAPTDKDGNGPFDSILLIADPYVAGPYSEGDYEIHIPVSAALVAALRPENRADFEVQRAQ